MRAGLASIMAAAVLALAIGACGGGDDAAGDDVGFSSDSQDQVVEHWCEVQPGMSRDEVIEVLGEPTLEFDAESSYQPQSQFGEGFTVFYDSTGSADQLAVNELSVDEATQAQLDCPLVRE